MKQFHPAIRNALLIALLISIQAPVHAEQMDAASIISKTEPLLKDADRIAAYKTCATQSEKLRFLTYATNLPIAARGEPLRKQWLLDDEGALIANWPEEMKSALAIYRINSLLLVPELAACDSAQEAIEIMGKERSKTSAPLEDGEETAKQMFLPFEFELTVVFPKHRLHNLDAEGDRLEKEGDRASKNDGVLLEDEVPRPLPGIRAKDLSHLQSMARIMRRTSGDLPESRDDAVAAIEELRSKLAPETAKAAAPSIDYEIALMYHQGWGKEPQDAKTAKRFFRKAAEDFQGKFSGEALSYMTSAANVADDNGEAFVKYYKLLRKFEVNGTVSDLFPYETLDGMVAKKTIHVNPAKFPAILAGLKESVEQYLRVMTDEGTLRSFSKSKKALEYIARELEGDPLANAARAKLNEQ